MYTLKSIARRGLSLTAVAAFFIAAIMPATSAFADSLNPLTERSLTLSSSSPGWANTDGSGNSTYAPPNSGANGSKTGNYFGFRVSTDSSIDADSSGSPDNPITAMSFQYCTKSAGMCAAPGDNASGGGFDHGGADTASTADLNVNYPSADEVDSTKFSTVVDTATGLVKAVPGYTNENPKYQANGGTGDAAEAAKDVTGNFIVMWNNAGTWQQSTGWTATTSNQEEATSGTTGKQNTIILQNSTGLGLPSGTQMKVLFFATNDDYITNPGSGAFFVKINTFKAFTPLAGPTPGPENTLAENIARTPSDVIDGGVTVANVMNQSIQITTKVLETMEFSVGTVDPDTLDSTGGATSDYGVATGGKVSHGTCDTILKGMTPSDPQNVLSLGDQTSESSLATDTTYATHSYWRLSSNSSAGATVYYSGHTLSNTSGDEITPMNPATHGGVAQTSHQGSEQFGLAIASKPLGGIGGANPFDDGDNGVNYVQDRQGGTKDYENGADNGKTGVDDTTLTDNGADLTGTPDYTDLNGSYHTPRLDPLTPDTNYGGGSGRINGNNSLDLNGVAFGGGGYDATDATFAFNPMSDTVPEPIANESDQVVDCVTAKMRYIANIAATTPAGIYTTKINYIAAPQY